MNVRTALLGLFVVLTMVFASTTLYESTLRTTTTSTTTSTMVSKVSTIPAAYDQVASAYGNHLLDLVAINAGDFLGGYEDNATLLWKGNSGGCDGNYSGLVEFGPLFGALMSDQRYLMVSNENQTIRPAGGYWVVNSTFSLVGNSTASKDIAIPYSGIFQVTISAQDLYVRVDGRWMIASETWNFLLFDSSILERPIPTICRA